MHEGMSTSEESFLQMIRPLLVLIPFIILMLPLTVLGILV